MLQLRFLGFLCGGAAACGLLTNDLMFFVHVDGHGKTAPESWIADCCHLAAWVSGWVGVSM